MGIYEGVRALDGDVTALLLDGELVGVVGVLGGVGRRRAQD